MLDRILGVKRSQGKSKPLPFLAYSVFGDPMHRFEALPVSHTGMWQCSGADHTAFRLLLGLAWLNCRKVTIKVPDQDMAARLIEWAEEAERDIRIMLSIPAEGGEAGTDQSLSESLKAWRAETTTFREALAQAGAVRFGVINAFEVAQSLPGLYDLIKDMAFSFTDRSRLQWTPEELQGLLQASREARQRLQGLDYLSLASKLGIRLSSLTVWNAQTLKRALEDRLGRLDQLIRDYDHILIRLRALILAGRSGIRDQDDPLRRLTALSLDERTRFQSGLSHWRQAMQLMEQELVSDGWFQDFKGLQGISLEETDLELRALHTRIRLLLQWGPAWLDAALAQQWLQQQPEPWQGLLLRSARLAESDLESTLTYWYVHGWLERSVDSSVWLALSETSDRRALARALPELALDRLRAGLTDQDFGPDPRAWWAVTREHEPSDGDGIILYWDCAIPASAGDAFRFPVREEPHLPLEYLRLQQEWVPEDPVRRFSLPHPFPTLSGLWEASPGRWRPGTPSQAGSEGSPFRD